MRLGSLASASVQRHDAHGPMPTAPELKIGNNWGEPSAWFAHQGAGNVGDGTSRRRLDAFLFFSHPARGLRLFGPDAMAQR